MKQELSQIKFKMVFRTTTARPVLEWTEAPTGIGWTVDKNGARVSKLPTPDVRIGIGIGWYLDEMRQMETNGQWIINDMTNMKGNNLRKTMEFFQWVSPGGPISQNPAQELADLEEAQRGHEQLMIKSRQMEQAEQKR